MAFHMPPPSKWSHNQIIVATLIGTMIAIAIVAVISISLSPAHIYLSITDAKAGKRAEDTQFYNFTLVADNSSPRMAVLYGALNAEIWYSPTSWVPAVVEMAGRKQAPRNTTHISVSGEYWQSEEASGGDNNGKGGSPPPPPRRGGEPNNTSWSNCKVVVVAKVWFIAGGISTRSYNIRASCSKVNFRNHTAIVNCTHG